MSDTSSTGAESPLSEEKIEALFEALGRGASVHEASGIPSEVLEAGYCLAFSLYNAGNFKDAGVLFQALCVYNHHDERFWNGLGGCRQMNNDLAGAADAYGMAAYAGAFADPAPLVHAGICALKMGGKENAAACFDAALELGDGKNAAHAAYRERAKAMLELVREGGGA
ncbi:MAG: SycD/LcrH family type III secretion system chaperone [Desulfovibrio sp.]|jgi:type III secretion system low calcium response chaperone LcrH/SycD|nr:SycD/LcrH family type III secretion system chaperone [Desulfovibrio sp.]